MSQREVHLCCAECEAPVVFQVDVALEAARKSIDVSCHQCGLIQRIRPSSTPRTWAVVETWKPEQREASA